MQRFLFLLPILLLTLSGCSLPGTLSEGADLTENTLLFETESVSMLVPKSWTGATSATIPIPGLGSVVAAYVSSEVKGGFSNNLVILSDTLDRVMSSSRYSELNHLQTTQNYLEYSKISESDLTFTDSETSKLYVFEARYNENTPRIKFVQTARVCGSKVYLLHISLSLDKNPDLYTPLLESFLCK